MQNIITGCFDQRLESSRTDRFPCAVLHTYFSCIAIGLGSFLGKRISTDMANPVTNLSVEFHKIGSGQVLPDYKTTHLDLPKRTFVSLHVKK